MQVSLSTYKSINIRVASLLNTLGSEFFKSQRQPWEHKEV